jgi:hypothetical protein
MEVGDSDAITTNGLFVMEEIVKEFFPAFPASALNTWDYRDYC